MDKCIQAVSWRIRKKMMDKAFAGCGCSICEDVRSGYWAMWEK